MNRSVAFLLCLALAGCQVAPSVRHEEDPRTELPPPKPFEGETLPGVVPQHPLQLVTRWYGQNVDHNAELRDGVQPKLESAIHLWLRDENRYELVYKAQWGLSPNPEDSGYRGVDVRESGHYTLEGDILHLQPTVTEFTQLSGGNRVTQTISGENRSYVVHLDKRYLNVAGRCASWQVDPVCKESENVWFSLRLADNSTANVFR